MDFFKEILGLDKENAINIAKVVSSLNFDFKDQISFLKSTKAAVFTSITTDNLNY